MCIGEDRGCDYRRGAQLLGRMANKLQNTFMRYATLMGGAHTGEAALKRLEHKKALSGPALRPAEMTKRGDDDGDCVGWASAGLPGTE